jgi:hypothetical protein
LRMLRRAPKRSPARRRMPPRWRTRQRAPIIAARAAAPLAASLRKLEALKTRTDAALALAEKVLAAARTD